MNLAKTVYGFLNDVRIDVRSGQKILLIKCNLYSVCSHLPFRVTFSHDDF